MVLFDDFRFNVKSGELIQSLDNGEQKITRLTPQSSKLLHLLIKQSPDILTKEEIKVLLWPDVEVDFDNSLHFCIRQIRAALNDEPGNPKFIETLPRRGYRWIPPVRIQEKQSPGKTKRKTIIAVGSLLLIACLSMIALKVFNPSAGAYMGQKVKLAIMPIQTPDRGNTFFRNEIASELLLLFGNDKSFEVVGPTSTSGISPSELYDWISTSSMDYIINGKISGQAEDSSVLLEVIRASDGAHIWVRRYDSGIASAFIAEEVYEGLGENVPGFVSE